MDPLNHIMFHDFRKSRETTGKNLLLNCILKFISSLYHFCFSAAAPTKPCVHVCILQLGWFIAMRLNLTSTLLFSMGTKLNTVVGEGKGSPLLTHSHGSSSFRF